MAQGSCIYFLKGKLFFQCLLNKDFFMTAVEIFIRLKRFCASGDDNNAMFYFHSFLVFRVPGRENSLEVPYKALNLFYARIGKQMNIIMIPYFSDELVKVFLGVRSF